MTKKEGFLTELFGDKIAEWFTDKITALLDAFTALVPDLTTLIVLVFASIGMFTATGKWLTRATLVFIGGTVWLALS